VLLILSSNAVNRSYLYCTIWPVIRRRGSWFTVLRSHIDVRLRGKSVFRLYGITCPYVISCMRETIELLQAPVTLREQSLPRKDIVFMSSSVNRLNIWVDDHAQRLCCPHASREALMSVACAVGKAWYTYWPPPLTVVSSPSSSPSRVLSKLVKINEALPPRCAEKLKSTAWRGV